MISVMVHTANLIMRAGLESIIRTNPVLEVVGSSSGMTTLGQRVEELQPDVVLLEWLGSNEEAVLENELAFVTQPNAPAIVVLADNSDRDWAMDAINNGVRSAVSSSATLSLLPRSATADEIIASVVAAAVGLVVLHPDFIEDLFPQNDSSTRALPSSPIQALTPREIEVLGMLALGLANKTIAKRLGISEHTVKFHISSIFQKLNASSRTEAVALGARLGLIML
ncbi:MAG: response regulator transcription factor [Cyanobacteriota bacterium]|nr:response regulator transcription factor [Cyanobacteriota bacterium]